MADTDADAPTPTDTTVAPTPSVESKEPVTATGRRREAVARVRLMPGTGSVRVNGRTFEDYFPRESLRLIVNSPLVLTHQIGKRDVFVRVDGGGLNGQAGAIKMGIARAIGGTQTGVNVYRALNGKKLRVIQTGALERRIRLFTCRWMRWTVS